MRSSLLLLKNPGLKEKIRTPITLFEISQQKLGLQSLIKSREFNLVNKINAGKFPTYLVQIRSMQKQVVMKIFYFNNEEPSVHFKNEINTVKLSHPNIVSVLSYQKHEKVEIRGYPCELSYVIMEFAPYGNMLNFIRTPGVNWDEKLLRTYFHQLIEGIEYIHSQGIAHLDLKLVNLLIGEDFIMKITDFDVSQNINDKKVINTEGTKNCRAPEIITKECQDLQAVDIYSAGIILFMMKSRGIVPFWEDETHKGESLYDLLQIGSELFWKKHSEIQNKGDSFFGQDFRFLIASMTRRDPKERATLTKIKQSKWYQGPIYSHIELKSLMLELIRLCKSRI